MQLHSSSPTSFAEVYTPAILPMLIVFMITSIECIGDTSATCEASGLPTEGPELMERIKGALFNDSEYARAHLQLFVPRCIILFVW